MPCDTCHPLVHGLTFAQKTDFLASLFASIRPGEMSDPDLDKMLADLEAQKAELAAELEKLGLGDIDDLGAASVWKNYPDIVRVCHEAADDALLAELDRLIAAEADVNAASPYGETALAACFGRSAFPAMRLLIENGADASEFGWSDDHLAIARGDVPTIDEGSPRLIARDAQGRTLFLLACHLGHVAAADKLHAITPPEGRYTLPDQEGPVIMAALSGSVEMLDWALAHGYDIDEADKFGGTALLEAVEREDLAIAERLLGCGADTSKGRNTSQQNRSQRENEPKSVFAKAARLIAGNMDTLLPDGFKREDVICTPATSAHQPNMVRLLVHHGVSLEDFDSCHVPAITGADRIAATPITPEMFNRQPTPRAGTANPERVDIPFWREQIRTGRSGYSAEVEHLGKCATHCQGTPVWSFDRFGRTATQLPDGRWVLIAGEHEDHYDPDFCIYADVTVIHPDARVDHYIYPADIFPPTDFHTATLLDDHILLIGNLGYPQQRRAGETQVLLLDLGDFSVRRVETTGQNPGWISRHKAMLAEGCIIVSGGKIEPGYTDNPDTFALDLTNMVWSRAT